MIRQHAKLFTGIQFAVDVCLSAVAFPLAYTARLHLQALAPAGVDALLNPELHPMAHYAPMLLLALPVWSMAAYSLGLYRLSMRRSGGEKMRLAVESSVLLGLFLGFLSFALKLEVSRPLIALFLLFQASLLVAARCVVSAHSTRRGVAPWHERQILIIGSGPNARALGALIARYSEWGLKLLGYVEADPDHGGRRDDVLGGVGEMHDILERNVVDEVIFVGNEPKDLNAFEEVLAICREQGIRTRVAANFFPAKVSDVSMEFMEGVPLITFSTTPDHPLALLVKRGMDVAISATLLAVLAPLMAVIALLVKLTSAGPVVYRQVRCGLYGRRFVLYKFRSMHAGAEDVLWEIRHLNEMDGPVFKMRNDPRVTPLGRWLRRSSIDELPQLWNVLKGEMSLVGPRAPLPEEVREYTRWQRRRLSVKPGITCLWQVSGRNEIDFHAWMQMDLSYIDNWSLLLDFKILMRTFPVVLMGKGAR